MTSSTHRNVIVDNIEVPSSLELIHAINEVNAFTHDIMISLLPLILNHLKKANRHMCEYLKKYARAVYLIELCYIMVNLEVR